MERRTVLLTSSRGVAEQQLYSKRFPIRNRSVFQRPINRSDHRRWSTDFHRSVMGGVFYRGAKHQYLLPMVRSAKASFTIRDRRFVSRAPSHCPCPRPRQQNENMAGNLIEKRVFESSYRQCLVAVVPTESRERSSNRQHASSM